MLFFTQSLALLTNIKYAPKLNDILRFIVFMNDKTFMSDFTEPTLKKT